MTFQVFISCITDLKMLLYDIEKNVELLVLVDKGLQVILRVIVSNLSVDGGRFSFSETMTSADGSSGFNSVLIEI